MSAAELMTWNKDQRRWFKKTPKAFLKPGVSTLQAAGCPTLQKSYPDLFLDATKEGSRLAANQWWRDKLAALAVTDDRPNAEFWQTQLAEHQARRNWHAEQGDEQGVADERTTIDKIEAVLAMDTLPESPKTKTADTPEGIVAQMAVYPDSATDAVWRERLGTKPKSIRFDIGQLAKEYGEHKKGDISGLGITAGRAYNVTAAIRHFVEWCEDPDVRNVKSLTLVTFKNFLVAKCDDGKMSRDYARDVMAVTRSFILWCFDTAEVIDTLPRNINKKRELSIYVPVKAVKPWKDEQVKTLFEASGDRERLIYLLTLNTGMLAKEIAAIANEDPDKADEADYFDTPRLNWTKGTLTRKRSKTRRFKDVPTVTYKLWPETMRLLRKFGQKTDPILRTDKNTTMLVAGVKTTGKCSMKRHDNIGQNFRRLRKRLVKKGAKRLPPIKTLRHTASTKLDHHDEYSRYTLHFLGHSPRGVALRHYVTPSQQQFDKALDWLGKEIQRAITPST